MLAVALGFIAAWLGWFLMVRVTVLEPSAIARLEVVQAPHAVQATASGVVVAAHVSLDEEVKAGDVLVELDARDHVLRFEEEERRIASLQTQLERARAEADADNAARRTEQRTAAVAVDEAASRARGARAAAEMSRVESETLERLVASKSVPVLDVKRADAERVTREEAAQSLEQSVARLALDATLRGEGARARREKLLREIAEIEGDIAAGKKGLERIARDIERRTLRAPVSGRLGDTGARLLRPGARVEEGDVVATIIPAGSGGLRVIAHFPVASIGRVRADAFANVRLDSFPFTSWGTLRARVRGVATEANAQGLVRVELDIVDAHAIPVHHGLTGVADVEVDSATPASLVLRFAGRAITSSATRTGGAQ